MLNLTKLKQPLPQSTENIQIVEVSNKTLTAYKFLPLPFQLGPLQDNHSFLLIDPWPGDIYVFGEIKQLMENIFL